MSLHASKPGATTRSTFNLTAATAAALQSFADREGVTLTEALKRLVGIGDFVYRAIRDDEATVTVKTGASTKEVVLL